MSEHVLDLAKSHFTKRHGDITVYGTWLRTSEKWEPCLAIVRTGEELSAHTVPVVFTLSSAYIFDERHGDAVKALLMTIGFAEALRLNHTERKVIHRLYSIIHDHLGDLISIPPKPFEAETTSDLIITNRNTGKSRELVINESS